MSRTFSALSRYAIDKTPSFENKAREAQHSQGSTMEMSCARKDAAVIDPVCFAGRVQQVLMLSNGGTILKTDLPTRGGDSGGPLFNTKGELLGVHIATGYGAFRRQSLVNRPDLTWLQTSIAADQSLLRNDSPSSPFVTGSSEPLHITINLLRDKEVK
nr:trypsin-like peptidase domain-containing protein [Nitrosomonas nitrosa]